MLHIKKGGHYRHVSKRAYKSRYKRLGYEIVEEKDPENESKQENNGPVELVNGEDYTVEELKQICRDEEISGFSNLKENELVELINKERMERADK